MEESNIFKNIWKFNAVIIAVAGIFAVIIMLFAIYSIYKDQTRSRFRNEIVNIDPESEIEETFRLGRIVHVEGSQTVIAPLYSDQSFSLKYSGKSTASTRNLLFSNMHTETNKWLLPNNDFLVPHYRLVSETNSSNEDKKIITILYHLVKADTNNDSRLTDDDKLAIALSDPEGNNYTEILTDIDNILGYKLLNKKSLAILFNRNGQGFTIYINLADFTVSKETELPKIHLKPSS